MISVVLDRWQKQTMFLWSNLNHHFEALSLIMPFYWDLGAPYSLQPSKINQTQQFYEILWFSIKWFQSTVISAVFFRWRYMKIWISRYLQCHMYGFRWIRMTWVHAHRKPVRNQRHRWRKMTRASLRHENPGFGLSSSRNIYILGFLAFCSNRVSNVIS